MFKIRDIARRRGPNTFAGSLDREKALNPFPPAGEKEELPGDEPDADADDPVRVIPSPSRPRRVF